MGCTLLGSTLACYKAQQSPLTYLCLSSNPFAPSLYFVCSSWHICEKATRSYYAHFFNYYFFIF